MHQLFFFFFLFLFAETWDQLMENTELKPHCRLEDERVGTKEEGGKRLASQWRKDSTEISFQGKQYQFVKGLCCCQPPDLPSSY